MTKRSSTASVAPAMPWQMTFSCTRAVAERFELEAEPLFIDWPSPPAIMASEPDESQPDAWQLDIIFETKPTRATIDAIAALIPDGAATPYTLAQLPDTDWVTQSQAGLEPMTAGPFHVRHDTADSPRADRIDFLIPASRAFGTGQHETTRGCLLALADLKARGMRYGNIADIGTGTGLLAFAANRLWPRAHVLASDIDPVAVDVSAENADLNGVPLGVGAGALRLVAAPGVEHPLIQGLAPYDLLIANILAGPLIELAPSLSAQVAEGGTLMLAGLLDSQAGRVQAAYRAQGMVLIWRFDHGDWPTLVLRKRHRFGWRRTTRWRTGDHGAAPGFGSW
ncbi:ribosomal protein L11 methyltransferase [Sphingobium sp. B11D3B]|uniref:50S ribosomal protein L11 methyltransferase n=1 Tax=Sphingobium sp. B11D3B TaxID=2940575 RepID=UPI0022270A4D|nr:50S ribosomal protein L11 methyltransferase [Sphingobium sp. B11D3B]MCW2388707.1 ribosomal protein L11 methyltransferase [Sphingobium sp. B11D3B]